MGFGLYPAMDVDVFDITYSIYVNDHEVVSSHQLLMNSKADNGGL